MRDVVDAVPYGEYETCFFDSCSANFERRERRILRLRFAPLRMTRGERGAQLSDSPNLQASAQQIWLPGLMHSSAPLHCGLDGLRKKWVRAAARKCLGGRLAGQPQALLAPARPEKSASPKSRDVSERKRKYNPAFCETFDFATPIP